MIIQNFDELGTSQARQKALTIVNAGLEAIQVPQALANKLGYANGNLQIGESEWELERYERVFVLGIGKVAHAVARELANLLGDRITGGVVLGIETGEFGKIRFRKCSHPLPSEENIQATRELVAVLEQATEKDLVLIAITGGGSAMLCLPYRLSASQLASVTQQLMDRGAAIGEMNTVRKHLSRVKGGGLAALAPKTQLVSLIFSDVPGDDLSVIASGPTVLDPTSAGEAVELLYKYEVTIPGLAPEEMVHETPKDPGLFREVRNLLLVTKNVALDAMEEKARELGFEVDTMEEYLQGEARDTAPRLLERLRPGKAVLAAGETTVQVKGEGRGGRNQEVVLGSLGHLASGQLLVSVASDGRDLTEFAGAVGDGQTVLKAAAADLNPEEFLEKNDSSTFFSRVGDGIITGQLESNVADLIIALEEE